MTAESAVFCRVCGLSYEGDKELPWGKDGRTPSYDNCICCGAEFGYHDTSLPFIREYRKDWLEKGAKWLLPTARPNDWSLEDQLAQIPVEFQ